MHIYKAKQTISIPSNVNLTELLLSSSSSPGISDSHIIAIDDLQNRSITIGELRENAGKLAQGLTSEFKPRDQSRWAVLLPNGIISIEVVHAILWQNGIFCPINHDLQAREISHALTVCKPEYAVVSSTTVPKVLEAFSFAKETNTDFTPPILIVALGSLPGHHQHHLLDTFRSQKLLAVPHHPNTKDRLASIHLSSGTTGKPKGVGLTHYNYIANVHQCFAHDPIHWSPTHSTLVFTPMAHIANTTIPYFLSPWTGTKVVIMAKFDIPSFCHLAQKHKVVDISLPRPLVQGLLSGEIMKKYDLSSVKYIVSTGGMKQQVLDGLSRAGNWGFINLYGMTEGAPYVAWSKIGTSTPAGQIGPFVPNMEARLCDSSGRDVPVGESGELWLRGPNMTKGYIDNPDANAVAFKDGDWYNTGDVCTISPEGNLAVVGRTKELFKSSGFQVSPQELEAYLTAHLDILEVAVGPTYDRKRGTDVATAYVVLRPGLQRREEKLGALDSIRTFLDGKVSGYKKLKGGVWEVTLLPKNGTGKVMRNQIADHKTGLVSLYSVEGPAKL